VCACVYSVGMLCGYMPNSSFSLVFSGPWPRILYIDGVRCRGKQPKRWLDNITEWTGLSIGDVVRMTQDRDVWRSFVWHQWFMTMRHDDDDDDDDDIIANSLGLVEPTDVYKNHINS